MKPSMADRAYFYSLQGLAIEWIAYRLGIEIGHAIRLVRDGKLRSEAEAA